MPMSFDGPCRAAPHEPRFTLLARDPECVPALLAWCRARLQRLRAGEAPLDELRQVDEAIVFLKAQGAWRRFHAPPRFSSPAPSGMVADMINSISREVARLAGASESRAVGI